MLRLASRIDAVSSRVQTAVTMRKVTSSMSNVVRGMESAMQSMNLEKISMVMDKFETQFEDLDVQSQVMQNSISSTTSMMTPQDDVERLMRQVADEHGLELNMTIGNAPVGVASTEKESAVEADDDFEKRLAKLRE